MTDDVTVEQKMVKDYIVVSPDLAASKAQEELTLAGASYCVVISSDEKEPLTIVTSEQLKGLPDQTSSLADELVNLPPAVIVEPTRTMDQIVDDFSPLLLGERAIRGLLVQGGGQIEGILPRRTVSDHAGFRMRVRTLSAEQIEGDPISPARVYTCPKGDYETRVTFYDRRKPPRCPNDRYTLVLKR